MVKVLPCLTAVERTHKLKQLILTKDSSSMIPVLSETYWNKSQDSGV